MRNIFSTVSVVCIFSLMLTGCYYQKPEPPMTQLQIREIQTRTYDTNNLKLVMKSMMDVLQDEGFIIKNAVLDLGLLSAEKHIDIEDRGNVATARIVASFLKEPTAPWNKQQILEASANVSSYGSQTRIRMNFQTKILNNLGNTTDIITIKNSSCYQDFFDKVSKGIFLQEQNI